MPFDGAHFPPMRPGPRPSAPSDNTVSVLIIAFVFSLLVMPISLAAFADIVRYFRGS